MNALIILLLLAVVGGWLFWRIARMLRLAISPKRFLTVAAIIVIGVLVLYASSHH